MSHFLYDPEVESVTELFAVVYTPKRQRTRFPENCVIVVESEQQALEQANTTKKLYPAKVVGPYRSSEGFKLYYLVNWLNNLSSM